MRYLHRLGMLTAASLFAISISGIGVVFAAGDPDPPGSRNPGPVTQPSGPKGTKDTSTKPKKKKTTEQEFRDGYRAAYALVQGGDYKAAFEAFAALDADDTPDVANYMGYTARKLGD
jgi:TolA-binding protein